MCIIVQFTTGLVVRDLRLNHHATIIDMPVFSIQDYGSYTLEIGVTVRKGEQGNKSDDVLRFRLEMWMSFISSDENSILSFDFRDIQARDVQTPIATFSSIPITEVRDVHTVDQFQEILTPLIHELLYDCYVAQVEASSDS